jgi:hypothetical protein
LEITVRAEIAEHVMYGKVIISSKIRVSSAKMNMGGQITALIGIKRSKQTDLWINCLKFCPKFAIKKNKK